MDKFQQMRVFAAVVDAGSFVGAAAAIELSKAAVSRHVQELEARLGVRLLQRTTRRLSLTDEGRAFHARCKDLLANVDEAEAEITVRAGEASGLLKINVPVSFGNLRLAPLWGAFLERNPKVTLDIVLADRMVDLVEEGFDMAVRIARLPDSSLVSRQLASTQLIVCASPAYLARHGTPQNPGELARFDCLTLSSEASQTRGWAFKVDGELIHLKPRGPLDCSDGQVLHDWCLAGYGIAWRSTWEVESEISSGRLVTVLEEFAAPPNGIYAVFPQRKHLPLRVRLWIDFLKHHYSEPEFWRR